MKRKQKGEVALALAAAYMIAGFLVIVTNGGKNIDNLTKKAEAPVQTQVAEAK